MGGFKDPPARNGWRSDPLKGTCSGLPAVAEPVEELSNPHEEQANADDEETGLHVPERVGGARALPVIALNGESNAHQKESDASKELPDHRHYGPDEL